MGRVIFELLLAIIVLSLMTPKKKRRKKGRGSENHPFYPQDKAIPEQTFTNNINAAQEVTEDTEEVQVFPYVRKKLFTKTEYIFYKILKEKCDRCKITIYPKTRMEDYIDISGTSEILKYRGYIKSRHIDFILANEKFEIIAGIELDDRSHETDKAKKTDRFKDNVFAKIGLPLYRINVSANYGESIDAILKELTGAQIS